jgi:hypothetical protein
MGVTATSGLWSDEESGIGADFLESANENHKLDFIFGYYSMGVTATSGLWSDFLESAKETLK